MVPKGTDWILGDPRTNLQQIQILPLELLDRYSAKFLHQCSIATESQATKECTGITKPPKDTDSFHRWIYKKRKKNPEYSFLRVHSWTQTGSSEDAGWKMCSLSISKVMLMFFEVWNPYLRQNIDLALKEAMEVKQIP